MIAFLGAGLLGSGFVTSLRRRGEAVNVWNRSPAKARALEAVGATAYDDPVEAVAGADRVHIVLSDDAAVDAVLARILPALPDRMVIVDHTTTTASGASRRVARANGAHVVYVHAPVFMGPQNAHDATGLMLVSGPRKNVVPLLPELEKMTGKVVDLGERSNAAACMKLLGNLFLMFLTSGLAEAFALGKALDVPPEQVAELFSFFNPGATLPARVERMMGAEFGKTSWGLDMARKDAGLMLSEAARGGVPLPVLGAIAAQMDAMLAEGHAKDDWTVIAKHALEPKPRMTGGRIVVVVATGTDVGKTHVTCALLSAARARGVVARATKPVATGLDEEGRADDARAHARASAASYRAPLFGYARAVSPHLAAREEGKAITVEPMVEEARTLACDVPLVLVETAGGLFSPLGPGLTNAEVVRAIGAWVLVAPDRLGVLHDVTAALRAAQAHGLAAPVVVLSAPAIADASTGSNARELALLGVCTVAATFPRDAVDAPATRAAADAVLAAVGV